MKVRQCKQNGCRELIPYENDYCDAHKALAESKSIHKGTGTKAFRECLRGLQTIRTTHTIPEQ